MKKLLTVFLLFVSGWCVGQDQRIWATYYGGRADDFGVSVATDNLKNVYLAGQSRSDTAISFNGFQNNYGGGLNDAFLVKFDSIGNRLWGTYYGGISTDNATSVAIDVWDNVYIAGQTSSDSGIALGGYQDSLAGGLPYGDAFIAKFDAFGNRLWATYYGGTNYDWGTNICSDNSGNIYLSGYTMSDNGIALEGFQNAIGGGNDAFLVKFDSLGNRLWATYYGGTGDDYGQNVVCDIFGNVYLCGFTISTSGIASNGFQNNFGGLPYDAFLVKFDTNGNRLWSTYYGGTNSDKGECIATDNFGNIYLGGETRSASGIAYGGFQNTFSGLSDAFLVKFDAEGNRLWATYYSRVEEGNSVSTDALGNVFFAGETYSDTGIALNGFQNNLQGEENGFLVKFSSTGERICATYYGNGHDEQSGHVTIDISGNVYLSGNSQGTSGISYGGFQNTYGGGFNYGDAYLVKFSSCKRSVDIEEDELSNTLTLYPNPATTTLTIESTVNSPQTIVAIYNTQGQEVYHSTFDVQHSTFDISQFPTGLYYLTLQSNEGVATKKFEVIR